MDTYDPCLTNTTQFIEEDGLGKHSVGCRGNVVAKMATNEYGDLTVPGTADDTPAVAEFDLYNATFGTFDLYATGAHIPVTTTTVPVVDQAWLNSNIDLWDRASLACNQGVSPAVVGDDSVPNSAANLHRTFLISSPFLGDLLARECPAQLETRASSTMPLSATSPLCLRRRPRLRLRLSPVFSRGRHPRRMQRRSARPANATEQPPTRALKRTSACGIATTCRCQSADRRSALSSVSSPRRTLSSRPRMRDCER
eukprot:Opistho-2@37085